MAGTPEKMLEHLLETRLDNKGEEELGMYRGNTIFTRNKNYIFYTQAFIFMVGPRHCPMFSEYGLSLSEAVDPSFLVVKISHFNKNIHLTASL